MSCKKNLTSDQLEAMFTATDEEMQQIEQPVECLIERTQYHSSSITENLKSKRGNAPTAVRQSTALTTWRST